MFETGSRPLVIWRLLDGKPGHESQTQGLVQALVRLAHERGQSEPVIVDMPLGNRVLTLWDWLFKRFPLGFIQPRPDFIVAAGHRTHWPLLCARRAYGGIAVALMTPSLPRSWFDVVVAPRHDEVAGGNVIETEGVLNPMRPAPDKRPGYTVVLVGGESRHFRWDSSNVLEQIEAIMARHPQVTLTDSRRTPAALRQELARRWPVIYQPWDQGPPGWLADTLAKAENAWVSEDSVSMIYESLTAGCAVGLISLDAAAPGRLSRGIAGLVRRGHVTRLSASGPLSPLNPPLDESMRVAKLLSADQAAVK